MCTQKGWDFRVLASDRKFDDLESADIEQPLNYEIKAFLERDTEFPASLRILDFGCGRGQLVGQLRHIGMEAYGVDIDTQFISSGNILSAAWRTPYEVLSVLDKRGRSIFPDLYFDAIISDQVLEHASDLDAMAAEMSRLLKPGGVVFHRFPGRWKLFEPHYHLPLVHLMPPRSRLRHLTARILLSMGWGVPFSTPLPLDTRTRVVCGYADAHTFYRSPRAIARAFARHGITLDFGPFFRWYLLGKLRSKLKLPRPLLTIADLMLRSGRLVLFLGDIHSWRVTGVKRVQWPLT